MEGEQHGKRTGITDRDRRDAGIKIRLTDYGLEFYGDITEITRVKEARCVYIG